MTRDEAMRRAGALVGEWEIVGTRDQLLARIADAIQGACKDEIRELASGLSKDLGNRVSSLVGRAIGKAVRRTRSAKSPSQEVPS